ncbi:protein-export chaperone SecB [Marinospirillum minutulum]|uniref:protein-export chaperone SecB n=1 Tax=Marinospirillum minutulum TaxID=64974 RepID=UPI00040BD427|nr:protein-export chaperone SecB [Marinospirillum minutulum]
MKFQLVKTLAKELSIHSSNSTQLVVNTGLIIDSFKVSVRSSEVKESQGFAVCFQIKLTASLDVNLVISCEYWAFFEGEEPLSKEFLEGSFASINAPAIAYPYLRSFITNTLVGAGYPALYLPTVNFVELNENNSKNK